MGRSPGQTVQSILFVECSAKVPSLNTGKDRDYSDERARARARAHTHTHTHIPAVALRRDLYFLKLCLYQLNVSSFASYLISSHMPFILWFIQ